MVISAASEIPNAVNGTCKSWRTGSSLSIRSVSWYSPGLVGVNSTYNSNVSPIPTVKLLSEKTNSSIDEFMNPNQHHLDTTLTPP